MLGNLRDVAEKRSHPRVVEVNTWNFNDVVYNNE
jgi:hypothetical protein